MDENITKVIKAALAEDIPSVDVSSEFLFTDEISSGKFIAKEDGVISGIDICAEVFRVIDNDIDFKIIKNNGDRVYKSDVIATVKGKTKSILMAERVGLNFLQRMSGIASMTDKYVSQTSNTKAKILDTRKTTPLIRALEKRAVLDGGGVNHRMSLSDMVMLKDNHLQAAKSIIEAVAKVRKAVGRDLLIEVEVENIKQFEEALISDCDIIMLDNMANEVMKECVSLNNSKKLLEASGNMTLERIKSVAEVGVDYISVGALTHSYRSLDISLKF